MIAEAAMIGLMIYQLSMPEVKNGKYQVVYDGENIIRMNTQDGTMERCDRDLKCVPVDKKKDDK